MGPPTARRTRWRVEDRQPPQDWERSGNTSPPASASEHRLGGPPARSEASTGSHPRGPHRGAARLAPSEAKLKKPKGFAPLAADELVELASWLERVPVPRRAELGGWLLERTWTSRDPRLWSAIGRLGARVPVYASVHHVIPPSTVERWLDHLLREKWPDMPTAAAAAAQMARVTDDRARDVSPSLRATIAARLAEVKAPDEWIRAVREHVPVAAKERAERLGEELPVGLRLVEE